MWRRYGSGIVAIRHTGARPLYCSTEEDGHVLAAALECKAGYLLTLDRHHLLTPSVQSAGLPLAVSTPGDFLREIM